MELFWCFITLTVIISVISTILLIFNRPVFQKIDVPIANVGDLVVVGHQIYVLVSIKYQSNMTKYTLVSLSIKHSFLHKLTISIG